VGERNALVTRLKIEQIHPDIIIRSPLASSSHLWELDIDDEGTAFFNDFWDLAHAIADRYTDVKPWVS
jgi:hypothetical protein